MIGYSPTNIWFDLVQKQGREGIKSGMTKIFGGIFAPPLLIGLINAMGVSLDCLSPGLLV